jgi:hypothetical protein
VCECVCVCVCVCLFVNVFELVWPCVALCGIVSILADSQDVKYFELRNDFTLPTNNNCMGDGLPCTTFYHETCHNLASEALDADIYVVGIEHVRFLGVWVLFWHAAVCFCPSALPRDVHVSDSMRATATVGLVSSRRS